MPASVDRVLIVGGGIAGLSTAIALRQIGVEHIDVLEINSNWSVYGVGIVQATNAFRALERLGLAEAVLEAGWPMHGRRIHDRDGVVIDDFDTPSLVKGQFPPASGIARPALHRVLKDGVHTAGVDVRLGVTIDAVESRADGVEVELTDGTSGSYDLIVGADGIRSQIRRRLLGDKFEPQYTGQVCWRYNVPRSDGLDRSWLFTGGRGKAGFIPLSETSMYILLIENASPEEMSIAPAHRAEVFREHLASYGGPVGEVRDHHITDPAAVVYRPVEEVVVPEPWHRGRVVLVGDAVHATSPDLGQGSAMAYEDVIVLTQCLAGEGTVEQQLHEYSRRWYPRARLICDLSRQIQRVNMTNGPADELVRLSRIASEHVSAAP
jgi:2-polyprenyl-6-methoxyphenol hydroxylase-like FAD-dependent oxidoreductase